MSSQIRIFWLEDDLFTNQYHIAELKEHYTVTAGAGQSLVDEPRSGSFDLLIVDLMIHRDGPADMSNTPTTNLHYDAIGWRQTGIEFLRRVRAGQYEQNGLLADIPAIVVTGSGDEVDEKAARGLAQGPLLTKPCTIDALLGAVASALAPRGGQHA